MAPLMKLLPRQMASDGGRADEGWRAGTSALLSGEVTSHFKNTAELQRMISAVGEIGILSLPIPDPMKT